MFNSINAIEQASSKTDHSQIESVFVWAIGSSAGAKKATRPDDLKSMRMQIYRLSQNIQGLVITADDQIRSRKVTFPADMVLPHAPVVAPGLIAAGFPQRGTCLWLQRESLLPQHTSFQSSSFKGCSLSGLNYRGAAPFTTCRCQGQPLRDLGKFILRRIFFFSSFFKQNLSVS